MCVSKRSTRIFPSADENLDETRRELALFLEIVEALEKKGVEIPLVHAANSAATLEFPEARLGMVRVWGCCFMGFARSNNTRMNFVRCSPSKRGSLT